LITAGLTLTDGGAMAVIRDDAVEFGVPFEEVDGTVSHDAVEDMDMDVVRRALAVHHLDHADVDEWSVGECLDGLPAQSGKLQLGGAPVPYSGYEHLASLAATAYCTSPFARRGEPTAVLVWDSDSFPVGYDVDRDGRLSSGTALFPLVERAYRFAAQGHALSDDRRLAQRIDGAAEIDAVVDLAATGTASPDTVATLDEAFRTCFEADTAEAVGFRPATGSGAELTGSSGRRLGAYLREVRDRTRRPDASFAASLQQSIGTLLTRRLADRLAARADQPVNLCVTGSAALNTAWNSRLRVLPQVREMWVSPFTNSAGSAIGAAALHSSGGTGLRALRWATQLGSPVRRFAHVPAGWTTTACRPEELARLLHRTGKPAAVLYGRAKLGPRFLGSRSIVAPAVGPDMRAILNAAAGGPAHRPVPAICLSGSAPDLFEPGTDDPYASYEHRIRPEWADRLPAITGADRNARLQTVGPDDDPVLSAILREYHKWSGIPALCAIDSPHLPDPVSAMRCGGVELVWTDNVLHRRLRHNAA
jgi:carbamoyltransferase